MDDYCMDDHMKEYFEYKEKIGDRSKLYKTVSEKYGIRRALYPGSHIDITPSLFIPDVTYIDNFKGAINFFRKIDMIHDYISHNKEYLEDNILTFFRSDYLESLDICKVDMIISQYAGFVGQATKRYLKENGILLCNDSHGDATLAYFDADYEFIGVLDSNNEIIETELDKYFKFSRVREVNIEEVYNTMNGPKYKHQPSNYLFRLKPQLK